MINKKAIQRYLNREMQSFDWLKDASLKDIERAIKDLDPVPDFSKIQLGEDEKIWQHQLACFLIIVNFHRFIPLLDMGLGKTMLSLMVLQYRKQCGHKPKAIVFVPYITAVSTWIDEVEKRFPDLKCVPLLGSSKDNRWMLENAEADLFVICYQSAAAMLSKKVPGKKGKTKWKNDPAGIRNLLKGVNTLIMDELQTVGNVSRIYHRMCRAISKMIGPDGWAWGLTGTPFGKDPTPMWGQFYIIDFGKTLGTTLGFFKNAFFEQKQGHWTQFNYRFKKELEPTLNNMMKNISIRYSIDECYDMPPTKTIKKLLIVPEDIAAYYDKAIEKIKELHRSGGRYEEIKSVYVQTRQLASGFMTFKGEENSTKVQVEFPYKPKLEALLDLIENMPYDSKMIVFHTYVFTNFMISKALTERKIKHARIWGGQKDKLGELKRFQKQKDCRVILLNDQSGSTSLNLQNSNYVVFYEQPDDPVTWKQAMRRAWRPGQKKKVFFIYLLMKGTNDENIYNENLKGRNFMDRVIDGRSSMKKLRKV